MRSYSEEELAAEEDLVGRRLPEELRHHLLAGVEDEVLLLDEEGPVDYFGVWGPRSTDTDTRGRAYPTQGLVDETQVVRDVDDGFLSEEVVVAWGANASGDLAVVLRDGGLGWWQLRGGATRPVRVIWEREEAVQLLEP